MVISYIHEFITLAAAKSFSVAAYQLHISQSTLSRHIQSMEKELGHPLFVRTTRDVNLSEYGQIYLPYAKCIINESNKADAAIQSYENQRNIKTAIGVVHNPELYMITESIIAFRREYPDISLQIFEGNLHELHTKFSAGDLRVITMAFADWETPQHGFIPAGKSRLVAILPANHPLALYDRIPHQCLENVRLMVPSQTTYIYQYLEHFFCQERLHLNIVYQGNTTGTYDLLKEEMGILIQDQALAKQQTPSTFMIRELEPDISYTFGLEYQNNLSKNEQLFVRYIRKYMETKK